MSKSAFFSALIALFCAGSMWGQDQTPKRWRFDASLGASYNSGNVEDLNLKNAGTITRNDSILSFHFGYKIVYSASDKTETNLNAKGGTKVDFLQYGQWSPFVAVEFLSNQYKGYNYKVGALSGVKFRIYSRPDTCDYSISCAFMFERVDYTPKENKLDNRAYRLSLRPKIKQKLGNIVSLTGCVFYQPSLESIDDYIIDVLGALDIKVTSHFYVGFNVEHEYRSMVPTEKYEHSDTYSEIVFGLKF